MLSFIFVAATSFWQTWPRGSIGVNHIADALNDVIVTEEITSATPFWAVLAIGLAGRLAADFGARVVRLCDGDDPLCNAGIDPLRARAAICTRCGPFCATARRTASVRRANALPLQATSTAFTCGFATTAMPTGWTGLQSTAGSDAQSRTWCSWKRSPVSGDTQRPASEFTIAATSGLLDIVGRSDARPLMLGGHQISYSTGLSGFLAAVALLHDDDLDRAEVSALGTALWINWKSLAAAAQGRPIPRRSAESGKWRTAPCADGHVALSISTATGRRSAK